MPGPTRSTADLCDDHRPRLRVPDLPLLDFGRRRAFAGQIETVVAPEDNTLVRAALEEDGRGRVLVVDGLGSRRCALLGDNIAAMAAGNGWEGLVIHGCVRDSAELAGIDLGVKALGTNPTKSGKRGWGVRGEPVTFGGVTFAPGDHLYADADGVVVADRPLAGGGA